MPLTPEPTPEARSAATDSSASTNDGHRDFRGGEPSNGLPVHSGTAAARKLEPEIVPEVPPAQNRIWARRLIRVFFALFAFEVGLFLVVFPWSEKWDLNYFQYLEPKIQDIWDEPSFRGALTGLGLVNIYIAVLQFVRAFRKR